MNLEALSIPRDRLPAALEDRIRRRADEIAARDARRGADRVRVSAYMENIGWPELFGFDMNRFFADPDFSLEMQVRQKILWADNAVDDSPIGAGVQATTGMYYDMTLFGQRLEHTREGVPQFLPHPLAERLDPALLPPFAFHASGDMPRLLATHARLRELSAREYDGALPVSFPSFHRGPLDILVQLRGYERFVDDLAARPERVDRILAWLVDERLRFARDRQRYLGEESLPVTTFVADDWVDVPFVSPAIFDRFVVPAYRRITANEGPVSGFHTCGRMEPLVPSLLGVFPDIRRLEVNGWNDLAEMDRLAPPAIGFDVSFVNTFVLASSEEEQRARLEAVAPLRRRRQVAVCAQAMVKLRSYEDTFARMNRFVELAREVLA